MQNLRTSSIQGEMYEETYSGEFIVHLVIFMAVLKLCQNKKEQTFVCWDAPFMNPFIAAGS